MRWRAFAIFLLVQQALWLLVVLPGHRRGVVTLPGYAATCDPTTRNTPASTAGHGCCPSGNPSDHRSNDPVDRRAHCAVCFDAVRMTPAAPPDLAPAPTGLTDRRPPSPAAVAPAIPLLLAYDSTGPPDIG